MSNYIEKFDIDFCLGHSEVILGKYKTSNLGYWHVLCTNFHTVAQCKPFLIDEFGKALCDFYRFGFQVESDTFKMIYKDFSGSEIEEFFRELCCSSLNN